MGETNQPTDQSWLKVFGWLLLLCVCVFLDRATKTQQHSTYNNITLRAHIHDPEDLVSAAHTTNQYFIARRAVQVEPPCV